MSQSVKWLQIYGTRKPKEVVHDDASNWKRLCMEAQAQRKQFQLSLNNGGIQAKVVKTGSEGKATL